MQIARETVTDAPRESRLFAILQLVRLPNVFTAVADVLMGFLVVVGGFTALNGSEALVLVLLIATTSLMYSGGMVLNDVFDFEVDSRERPNRPLPSGQISLNFAQWFGFELLLVATALGWAISYFHGSITTGIVATMLAGAVLLYDIVLKDTLLGPVGMGACRFLNVLLGMSVLAGGEFAAVHYLIAGGIGVYIAGVTILARKEAERSNRAVLVFGTIVMLIGMGMLAMLVKFAPEIVRPQVLLRINSWYMFWGFLGILTIWRCMRAITRPDPVWVQTAVKTGIMSLIVLDAVVVFAVSDAIAAAIVLLLLAPSILLGKWMYST